MRGVLSLAAAFSLPVTLSNGQPFAQRSLIVFLTFSIILVTLVGQGLTLPLLIRRLGLAGNTELEDELLTARYRVTDSAINWLQQQRETATGDEAEGLDELLHRYRQRLAAVSTFDRITHAAGQQDDEAQASAARFRRRVALLRNVASVERRTLLKLRDDCIIGDEVQRSIERELDLTETRFDELR
jgi:CPA1 family monovalent cation:H+ antiporter